MSAEQKTYAATRARVEARAAADALGLEQGPSNIVLEPARPREPAPKLAAEITERPLDAASLQKAAALAKLLSTVGPLELSDIRVLQRIADELPSAKLRAKCEALTEAAREPGSTPNNYRPTSRYHFALASLLGAWRDVERLVHGRRDAG